MENINEVLRALEGIRDALRCIIVLLVFILLSIPDKSSIKYAVDEAFGKLKFKIYEKNICGACGKELQAVRPGKFQCNNPRCETNRAQP